ncbi:MAG: DUF1624 domain-containing protein [Paucibacter sp.]|nr:DUF1624 domain-containing protein [Roseateles sp.]
MAQKLSQAPPDRAVSSPRLSPPPALAAVLTLATDSATAHAGRPVRQARLDALRGAAMVWMTAYHFCFDLAQFRWLDANFYADPHWVMQRLCIVSLFLGCAGMAQASGQPAWPRFWRRWAQVAGCALLVSIGSYWMFPRSFISFGVLHGMALMLILLRAVAPRLSPIVAGALGLACVLAPQVLQHPFFDTRWTDWIGLVTHKPITEDYVPVLPWFGLMLWGHAIARRWPGLLAGGLPRALAPLAFLGRWSLSYYMLHQPVMLGMLYLAASTFTIHP